MVMVYMCGVCRGPLLEGVDGDGGVMLGTGW